MSSSKRPSTALPNISRPKSGASAVKMSDVQKLKLKIQKMDLDKRQMKSKTQRMRQILQERNAEIALVFKEANEKNSLKTASKETLEQLRKNATSLENTLEARKKDLHDILYNDKIALSDELQQEIKIYYLEHERLKKQSKAVADGEKIVKTELQRLQRELSEKSLNFKAIQNLESDFRTVVDKIVSYKSSELRIRNDNLAIYLSQHPNKLKSSEKEVQQEIEQTREEIKTLKDEIAQIEDEENQMVKELEKAMKQQRKRIREQIVIMHQQNGTYEEEEQIAEIQNFEEEENHNEEEQAIDDASDENQHEEEEQQYETSEITSNNEQKLNESSIPVTKGFDEENTLDGTIKNVLEAAFEETPENPEQSNEKSDKISEKAEENPNNENQTDEKAKKDEGENLEGYNNDENEQKQADKPLFGNIIKDTLQKAEDEKKLEENGVKDTEMTEEKHEEQQKTEEEPPKEEEPSKAENTTSIAFDDNNDNEPDEEQVKKDNQPTEKNNNSLGGIIKDTLTLHLGDNGTFLTNNQSTATETKQ